MNTKAEQSKGSQGSDIAKLVLALLVLAAGIFSYSWYSTAAGSLRLAMVLVGVVASIAIAAFTGPGRRVRSFLLESQFELRKVVWPTRDETIKTTGIIIAVVVVLSLLLGLIDLILRSVVFGWLLKIS
ncbi:preprotein translocase subunit SecE [Frateuria aurantia]|uniref:Protein translocase subunit SecE n=1 Tax=Frateuria aurantia (strain ATCC 33424 / DSM 6220 / KCTC 2777 / LMG 1558 / NBRC 3245 / NCIMB 13370) TaxID=767434 RepID=H8KYI5_FRAAD|nr:preprotein translocase subunit SecE [Frateuria aurantia]AFC85113.1 preprotein translocase, SecE subunit [Frateuria aurantia DSM 6220]